MFQNSDLKKVRKVVPIPNYPLTFAYIIVWLCNIQFSIKKRSKELIQKKQAKTIKCNNFNWSFREQSNFVNRILE